MRASEYIELEVELYANSPIPSKAAPWRNLLHDGAQYDTADVKRSMDLRIHWNCQNKNCYHSAQTIALFGPPDLMYVEGIASHVHLPAQHAWLVDPHGCVIDPTHCNEMTASIDYFGIPIPRNKIQSLWVEEQAPRPLLFDVLDGLESVYVAADTIRRGDMIWNPRTRMGHKVIGVANDGELVLVCCVGWTFERDRWARIRKVVSR